MVSVKRVRVAQGGASPYKKYPPPPPPGLETIQTGLRTPIPSVIFEPFADKRFLKIIEPNLVPGSQGHPTSIFGKYFGSEDDLRSRILETFVVKFLACLPLLGFSNIYKMV